MHGFGYANKGCQKSSSAVYDTQVDEGINSDMRTTEVGVGISSLTIKPVLSHTMGSDIQVCKDQDSDITLDHSTEFVVAVHIRSEVPNQRQNLQRDPSGYQGPCPCRPK